VRNRRSRGVVAVVALTVVVSVAAGCGDDDDPTLSTTSTTAASTTTSESTTTSTTEAGSPTPTEPTTDLPDSMDSGKSELEDGRHFGYWDTFEIGDTVAFGEFDLAYFLTGDEAEAAAAEDGAEVTNDYYIVNDNPKLRTLIARGDTEVTVLTGNGAESQRSNVADFAVDRHPQAGFWVTIEDGIVVAIEEQYQP
jgi:hypothetical protein